MNDFEQVKEFVIILDVIMHETGFQMKGKGEHLEEYQFCGGHECFSMREKEGFFKCFQCSERGDVCVDFRSGKSLSLIP